MRFVWHAFVLGLLVGQPFLWALWLAGAPIGAGSSFASLLAIGAASEALRQRWAKNLATSP